MTSGGTKSHPSEPEPENDTSELADRDQELDRLRTEVETLHGQIDNRKQRRRWGFAIRRVIAAILVAVVGFGVVLSAIGFWGARTTLDTDRWVATVDDLPQDPAVASAVSTYLTTEVFNSLNLQQQLAEALPPRAALLAAPMTNAVRDYLRGRIRTFMQTEEFQQLWVNANRFAHTQILAVLEKRSETVSVEGDTVTLNLLPIVNNLLITLEDDLPGLFGKQLDLPTLTSGEVPAGLHQRIETALGVNLPSNFAQIKLYNRDRLGTLQQAVLTFKRSVALLIIGTVLVLGLALWISPNRRRSTLQLGLWLIVAVVVLSNVLRAVRDQLLGLVPDGVYREGVSAALYEVFTNLRLWGDWILWIGVAVAAFCYLIGPGRLAVALRRSAARGARATAQKSRKFATSAELRTWSARHVDVLRIAGLVVAATIALLFSSWTALFVIAIILVGYEMLVTLLARWGQELAPELSAQPAGPGPSGAR